MRKLLLPFLFGFLLVWLFGGAWWYAQQNQTQKLLANKTSIAPSFSVADGNFLVHTDEDISFFQSSFDAYIPERLNDALLNLTQHLKPLDSKMIILTGRYLSGELNNSVFDNLGLARAEALKSRLIRLGFDGKRVQTRGIKVGHLDSREGILFGAITLEVKN